MHLGKKPGISRRPIEYVLVALAIFLAALAIWAGVSLKQLNQAGLADESQDSQSDDQNININFIAEKSLSEENQLDNSFENQDMSSQDSVDSAADAVGGVYDESAY